MTEFEVEFPIVGTTRFAFVGGRSRQLTVADTYLSPLYDALFGAASRLGIHPTHLPQLMRWWSEQSGPYSVEGGAWAFSPDDGLLEIVRHLRVEGVLNHYDLSKVISADGGPARPMTEFLAEFERFIELAAQEARQIEIEELP